MLQVQWKTTERFAVGAWPDHSASVGKWTKGRLRGSRGTCWEASSVVQARVKVEKCAWIQGMWGVGRAEMVRCCSKYGGEGAAQPRSLSTQFRVVLTSTQGLLLAIYTSAGLTQPPRKGGQRWGLGKRGC